MSCVHYKYKNSLDYDTITFDGLHITLTDLRQSIGAQKKLGKSSDFLLQVINAQTKEEYKGDNTLIPRNASVIVQRVPVGARGVEDSGSHAAESQMKSTDLSKTADLVKAVGSEEEKIRAMMTQSTEEYDPSKYQRVRYRGPSSSYICFRCNKPGHHIRNCPMNGIKRATGIPQIFMKRADNANVQGAMLTASGQLAVPVIDSKAYTQGKKATERDFPVGAKVAAAPEMKKVERNAPDEMICPLCRKLMADAVLIPCCGRSYCDDCIRNYLLENRFVCPEPDCRQADVSPDNLIPNRSLRKAIDKFRNGVVGGKGASALKAAQLEAAQKPSSEKDAVVSEKCVSDESHSKNEGSRKKSPVGGDASRDSTPEADSMPSKPPTTTRLSQQRPDRPEHLPPPVGTPMIPPGGGFMPPPPPVPMYAGMMEVPVIPYRPVMPPVPVPMPFPGHQAPLPLGPTLGLDPGCVMSMDDLPPMSAEEFYGHQLEMRKRMGYSSSSHSSSHSSSSSSSSSQWSSQSRSSSWSRSRSPSSSRSLSYSPKRRHRSRHYHRSRSRSLSVSRRRRRHRLSPNRKHQSSSHHSSKHHHKDSPKRTGRHRRRRKSVSRSRSPVRRLSRSPHYGGSQSVSRTSHKTERRSKHRKRSRSDSPTELRVPKKEKLVKHRRGSTGEPAHSGRKETSKNADRDKKKARVESKDVTKATESTDKEQKSEMPLMEAALDPVKVSESVPDDGQHKGKMKKRKHHKHHKHRHHSESKPHEVAEVSREETGDSNIHGGTGKQCEGD